VKPEGNLKERRKKGPLFGKKRRKNFFGLWAGGVSTSTAQFKNLFLFR
jgi:hypothetical protein